MIAFWRCVFGGGHDPKRYFLGGFKCQRCGTFGADLEEMGFKDGGWVNPLRTDAER